VETKVVATEKLAWAGRQLVHAICQVEGHDAAFWTEKVYLGNEYQVRGRGRQRVVFVGNSRPANDLIGVLPNVYDDFGTQIYAQGTRAVLVASKPPLAASRKNLNSQIEKLAAEIGRLSTDSAPGVDESKDGRTRKAVGWLFEQAGAVSAKAPSGVRLRKKLTQLRYTYVMSHFLKAEEAWFGPGVGEE